MKSFIFLFLLLIIYSCSSSSSENNNDKAAIMKADIEFCKYSVREGFFNAFLRYADNDIIKFSEGQFPVIGLKNLKEKFDNKSGTKDLIWAPEYAEVAESGELGYTWGKWHLKNKDTTFYGNYFTVWKKQNDGSWKVKLDGGNSTPPPEK